ncbi:monocarboxylate transporter 12-like [Saccoglossus kowalevskii]
MTIMRIKKKTVTKTTLSTPTILYEDDPPDGGWGWVVVMAAHFALLLSQGSLTGFGPFIVNLQLHFGCGASEIAGVSGTALFVTLATGPVASALNCWFGCRVVVMAGGIISTIGIFISSLAIDVSHLYVSYGIVTGFGYGLVSTPSVAFIARYFKRKYALANGIVFSGFAIGWIALPQVYQLLINQFGWRNALMCVGAMDAHICICGALFRPPPQRIITGGEHILDSDTDEERGPDAALTWNDVNVTLNPAFDAQLQNNVTVPTEIVVEEIRNVHCCSCVNFKDTQCCKFLSNFIDFALFCNPLFILMAVAYFVIAVGFYPTVLFLVPRAESFGIPYPLPTTLMTITGAVSLIGRAGHGVVIDSGLLSSARALAISIFICGFINILSYFCEKYTGLAILYGVFGLANGVYHPLLAVTLKDFVGVAKLPSALGFCNLCHGLGALIGPPITGWIFDNSQDYRYCYCFSGLILCLSALLLFSGPILIRRRSAREIKLTEQTPEYATDSDSTPVLQLVTVV